MNVFSGINNIYPFCVNCFLINKARLSIDFEIGEILINIIFRFYNYYYQNVWLWILRDKIVWNAFYSLTQYSCSKLFYAERAGFEPAIRFWQIHTFQACALDHSATSPYLLFFMAAQITKKMLTKDFYGYILLCWKYSGM